MDYSDNIELAFTDDTGILYAAIYSNPEMAELISQVISYIEPKDMTDALYFAAMGQKEQLLSLVCVRPEN